MTYAPNARGLAELVAKATEGPWDVGEVQEDGQSWFDVRSQPDENGWAEVFVEIDKKANATLIAKTPDLAALLLEARALFLAPDPGSIETQRRILAFLEATE